jgi:TRAP transporter TAXI family solute receptor
MKSKLIAAAIASAATLSAPAAHAQQFINVLTGGTSGVYYPLGVAIGKIYGDKIPGVKTQVQATKASVENLVLLQQGRGEIAFTLGDSLKAAWDGDAEAGFKSRLDKLRTIGAIYPNYIQIVATADSGIKTLADLKGKSLSVGAPKSGTELNSRAILGAAGMSYKDMGKIEYLPFAESVDLMKNRQLNDAAIGRPRGRLAEGSLDLDRDHRGVGSQGGGRQDRPAVRRREHSRQYL